MRAPVAAPASWRTTSPNISSKRGYHHTLLDRVWGSDYEASPEYLKVFISRLRAKLRRGDSPECIQTERGRGYRFVRPREAPAPARLAG